MNKQDLRATIVTITPFGEAARVYKRFKMKVYKTLNFYREEVTYIKFSLELKFARIYGELSYGLNFEIS